MLDCYVEGIKAYFAFRNSEGGVHGRELVLTTVLDDELSNNQQRALEIVSADDTFGAFSATQVAERVGRHGRRRHPALHLEHPLRPRRRAASRSSATPASSARCAPAGPCPTPASSSTPRRSRPSATASRPNSADCATGGADSIELYGEDTGLELGYTNNDLAFGLPNGIGPEVTAMKDAGVDFIAACLDLNGMKTLAQELERQGMGDVPMFHPNTYDAGVRRGRRATCSRATS